MPIAPKAVTIVPSSNIFARSQIAYTDEARAFQQTPWPLRDRAASRSRIRPKRVETWWSERGRGVVVLPTGTGKTFLADPGHRQDRPADPGGHADHRPAEPVVRRIDAGVRRADRLASAAAITTSNRSPSPPTIPPTSTSIAGATASACSSSTSAITCRARRTRCRRSEHRPVSPGPDRHAGTRPTARSRCYPGLIGPIVYRREIKQLAGDFLAEYHDASGSTSICRRRSSERYSGCRETYRRFCSSHGISMGSPNGWQRFIPESCRSTEGRAAFLAYPRATTARPGGAGQARAARQAPATRIAGDRILIFTADNATVYQIARRFLVPAITHQTKAKERRADPAALPLGRVSGGGDEPGAQRRRGRAGRQRRRSSCPAPAACASTCSAWAGCCANTATSRRCCTKWSPAARPRSSPANGGGSIMRINNQLGEYACVFTPKALYPKAGVGSAPGRRGIYRTTLRRRRCIAGIEPSYRTPSAYRTGRTRIPRVRFATTRGCEDSTPSAEW